MKDIFFVIGFMIYVLVSFVDRFVMKINDITYICLCVIAIIFVITGMIEKKRNKDKIL